MKEKMTKNGEIKKNIRDEIVDNIQNLAVLITGIVLLIAYGTLFVTNNMSIQGDPGIKSVMSPLLGTGAVLILLSIRTKINRYGLTTVIIPIISLLASIIIYASVGYYPFIILAYISYSFGIIYLIFDIFRNIGREKDIENNDIIENKDIIENEDIHTMEDGWRTTFATLNNVKMEFDAKISEIEKNAYSTYDNYRSLKNMYNSILEGVGDAYIDVIMLDKNEYTDFAGHKLLKIIEKYNCEPWIPEIGQPAPDGCVKKAASGSHSYPTGTVVKVRPGVRVRNGDTIIIKPIVEVVTNDDVSKEN